MSRTRTSARTVTSKSVVCNIANDFYSSSGLVVTQTPYLTGYSDTCSEGSMVDVVTANFAKISRLGGIVNNPMTQIRKVGYAVPLNLDIRADYKWNWPTPPYRRSFEFQGYISPLNCGLGDAEGTTVPESADPSVDMPDESNLALEAYARVNSSPMNVFVTAGEAGETIDMLRGYLRGIRDITQVRTSLFRRGRGQRNRTALRGILAFARDSPKLWLHIRYGIRPLVGEVMGALKALQMIGSKNRRRFQSSIVRDSAVNHGVLPYPAWNDSGLATGIMGMSPKYESTVSVESSAGVLAEPDMEDVTLPQLLGMGNVIVGAWDLVPCSFVFDWFFNISNLLSAWSPSVYVRPLCGWVISTRTTQRKAYISSTDQLTWDTIPRYYGVSYSYRTITVRSFSGGFATETLVVKTRKPLGGPLAYVPTWNPRLGAAKVLDLLALAAQFRSMMA